MGIYTQNKLWEDINVCNFVLIPKKRRIDIRVTIEKYEILNVLVCSLFQRCVLGRKKYIRSVIREAIEMEKDEKCLKAKKRVENLKGFYIHLTAYFLVNTLLNIINLLTDASNSWFLYPLGDGESEF